MSNVLNFTAQQGDTLTLALTITDDNGNATDFTGLSARGQVRKSYNSSTVEATFVTDITDNIITLSIDSVTMASIDAGQYVYDVEMTDGGDPEVVYTLIKGKMTVDPEVTK